MAGLAARLKAIILQRCPKCLKGKPFMGLVTMRERCPLCGHRFEREPGYFVGARYASYFLAIPILALLTLLIYWLILPEWPLQNVVLIAGLPFLFLIPVVFRYSRVIWMHIDPPP